MYVGSLFSGIGGIELGFERAGFKTKWFIEKEPYCQKILRKNFPNIPIYGDIEKIDFTKLEKVEVLTGGFPCQDISYAGKGEGIKGKRSGLWKYYYQAIRVLQPKYIFIENVPALLNRGFNVVLADLATCGYNAEWDCIPAVAVGAPHRRDRIFIIGILSNTCNVKRRSEYKELEGGKTWIEIGGGSKVMANTDSKGLEGGIFGSGAQMLLKRYNSIEGRKQWEVEPELGRVAHGISNRMDRLRCLGNAVVPQIAEFIARRLLEFDRENKV